MLWTGPFLRRQGVIILDRCEPTYAADIDAFVAAKLITADANARRGDGHA